MFPKRSPLARRASHFRKTGFPVAGKSVDRLSILTVCAAAVVIALFAAAMGRQYHLIREHSVAEAATQAQRALVAFDDHAARLFTYADAYLRAVRAMYLDHGGQAAADKDGGDAMRELIVRIRPNRSDAFIGDIGVINADGVPVFATTKNLRRDVSIAHLPYFQALRDASDDVLVINSTRYAAFTGKFNFRIARRVTVDGRFAGIVLMTLQPEAISSFYQKFDLGPHSVFSMVHTQERKLIARHPEAAKESYDVPLNFSVTLDDTRTDVTSVTARPSPVDKVVRIFHYKKLVDYPVALAVGTAPDDIDAGLADTRRNLTLLVGSFGCGVVLVCGLLLILLRNNRRLAAARSAAEAARRRTDAVLDSAGEGICGVGAAGRIDFINPAGRGMLGWENAGVGGPSPFPPLGVDGAAGAVRLLRSDGSGIDVEYSSAPLDDGGVEESRVVVFRDVTERKALEAELRRTMGELEQFAYVASHDLRQPLRSVSQYLTLIKRDLADSLSASHQEFFDFAVDGARRMDRLILDLLEYSRTGRGGKSTPTALGEVIAEALANLAAAVDEAGAEIITPAALPTVPGIAGELTRLFQNIIGNAVKYRAPDRAPRIVVSCDVADAVSSGAGAGPGMWLIKVADNGLGIRPEDYERAFGVFQRLASSRGVEGTGIGLAICKKIVERHGGRIWIESAQGEGTTFLFTLPQTPLTQNLN
jgi:signal transduction histidine kinase